VSPAARTALPQPLLEAGRAEPAAVLNEHEVGESPVAGMWQGTLPVAAGEPGVEGVEGGLVQRHGAFAVELAQWDS
jgi:hypothetical protein